MTDEKVREKRVVTLEPRKFKVNQPYKNFCYFIELIGDKWMVTITGDKLNDFHYVAFRNNGFESKELAVSELEKYLKATK